jgi:hypothetical protein
VIEPYFVELTDGLQYPNEEATISTHIKNAVLHNGKHPTAHHDIILCTTTTPIAIQCKNSLSDPGGTMIDKQLSFDGTLLWFYPGLDESSRDPPKEYRTNAVTKALKEKKLGFLSAGCVSSLPLEVLVNLKKLKGRHTNTIQ